MPEPQIIPPLTAERVDELRSWQGRSETAVDLITAAPLRSLSATLDRSDPEPGIGAEVPPLWHWLFFLPRALQRDLGEDGHPRLGGFLPPVPLPRRMWAGGRLQWHAPLRVGDAAKRVSTIQSVMHKSGRSGDLVFVVVRHEISNAAGLAITEEHDIVYRAPPHPDDPEPPGQAAPNDAVWSRAVLADPVMLFRYSALTFNGHRIHYDRSYATSVEGYPGLIVHGPLIATLLVDLLRREKPNAAIRSFAFKAMRPTFDMYPFRICGRPAVDGQSVDLWGQDFSGWQTMHARAQLA
ncbi:MAG: MaoC family dehydratase N-terminal domain-containing protein [Ramlibacter sp.]|nr:MaoC family dehydratase N-terminal domain-containing protein [Ramlibacter sp.]